MMAFNSLVFVTGWQGAEPVDDLEGPSSPSLCLKKETSDPHQEPYDYRTEHGQGEAQGRQP